MKTVRPDSTVPDPAGDHTRLITDYVLGLMDADERLRLERHAQKCAVCREALGREQRLESLVRRAIVLGVDVAGRPAPERLKSRRPQMTPHNQHLRLGLYRQLAPMAMAMVLIALLLISQLGGQNALAPALIRMGPSVLESSTPTSTATPTATLAAVVPGIAAGPSDATATRSASVTPARPVPDGAQETTDYGNSSRSTAPAIVTTVVYSH